MKIPLSALGLMLAFLTARAEPPLILENSRIALRFDARTGQWIGCVDKATGNELAASASPLAALTPPQAPKLDKTRVERALAAHQAISLGGQWQYTPQPPKPEAAAAMIEGRYQVATWEVVSIPSRRGSGDDCLHERQGDFWYRRDFVLPPAWRDSELILVLGAVDDFDVTWINGRQVGQTGAETPHHWETPRFYHVPADCLHPGATNSLLVKVTNGGYDGGIFGPVVLGLAENLGGPSYQIPAMTRQSRALDSRAAQLRMAASDGPLEYETEFSLPQGQATFTRRLTVKNISNIEQLFQTAAMGTPALSVGNGQEIIFPGSCPAGGRTLDTLAEGESINPGSEEPLVVLWDATTKLGLGAWYHCEEEFSPVSVRRQGKGAVIRHTQGVIARLQPGESMPLGTQHFWLTHGSRDAALRGVQAVYREIGLRPPPHPLPGLKRMVMYCGHPGGPPELGYLRYGGFAAMQRYVPVLAQMHIDLLWFLPVWDHGKDPQWNLYSPFDHFQVDSLLGSAQDLQALSQTCATQKIRLMFDLVPHGPPDFTPLAKAHPEWVARTPEGANQIAWGQLAFDNHHPGWQAYMSQAAEWGAREFGAVGARVDCAAGGPLNWNREVGNRPSLSSLAAGLGMSQAIRTGYERVHRQALLLPEEYTGAVIYNRVSDLTYDAQFYFLQSDLLDRNASPEIWAREIQAYLHDQQQALPPGALKMRWISNHDTVSWTFQKQRPVKAYGLGRMRALLAICALIEGVPMLYQGDEDPAIYGGQGESNVSFLSQIYGLRKTLPALSEGRANYSVVRASDGVFACLRETNRAKALVLVSLNPSAIDTHLSLPKGFAGRWRDVLGAPEERIKLTEPIPMQPWQVRVLTR